MKLAAMTLVTLGTAAMLASCSIHSPAATVPAQASANADPAGTAVSAGTPVRQDAPPPQASPDAAPPSPSPAKTEKPILYKMNKAYRFEPVHEGIDGHVVLLTFDDGPKDEAVLTKILDTLDKHKAKAIFFVNGYRVERHPELLKLIDERGQAIGNHSWDHIDLKQESAETVKRQLGDVQEQTGKLLGKKPRFFRPPYGSGGDEVKRIARNHGMLYMTWSNGSLDWDDSAKGKPKAVIDQVMSQLHPGANILMHELEWTADALDELLLQLEDKGYGFIDPDTIDPDPTA